MCDKTKFCWIEGFAEELDELAYDGLSNWFVSFGSLPAIFGGHFSYLIMHLSIITCGVLTLKHAKANGSRFVQFWWGAMIHGILSENSLTTPKYWHAQAVVMLFGKSLPLHMVFFYPTILYLSVMAIQKFKLSPLTEPAAVGMFAMIMELPFRIVSVKFLHITYHDTEPIYSSKFYGVPWVEIISTLVFATSYAGNFYALKYHGLSEDHIRWERVDTEQKEAILTGLAGLVSPISAFVQKILFFHVLHDSFNVNAPTCLLFLFTVYFSVVYCYESGDSQENDERGTEDKNLLLYCLGTYLGSLFFISMIGKPQNEISIGVHETTGDCTTLICSRSPLGKATKRKKYLCVDDVQERSNFVYDFACLPDGPPCLNAIWYTICGTPIRNRAQFMTNIFSFIILISTIFLKSMLTQDETNKIMKFVAESKICRFLSRMRPGDRDAVVTFQEQAAGSD